ncbi:MAG TPA: molybdopterin converting factor subunit 1 [Bacillota bacterium]|nr:molybdopterin converting factor subunit 1 [Bacillota bacterium]
MVDVLLFAELQEATGKDKIAVEAAGMTVAELKKNFVAQYHMENMSNVMVAVNEEYARDDAVINEGDVVAFIPPVSGG